MGHPIKGVKKKTRNYPISLEHSQQRAGSGFTYHKTLAPLLWVFLSLQVIELAVVHFLLMLWNSTVAWVLSALTALGILWMIALIRSFYSQPVTLGDRAVRIRWGLILDLQVPYHNIAATNVPLDRERAVARSTCNPAFLFMTAPNVVLGLQEPMRSKGLWGRERSYDIIALRLDEPERFYAELHRHLED